MSEGIVFLQEKRERHPVSKLARLAV